MPWKRLSIHHHYIGVQTSRHGGRLLRLRRFEIFNFRSIRHAVVDNLQSFVVFTGQNNAGKSNLLEALTLLFSQFDSIGGKIQAPDEFLWFQRNRREPAVFRARLELEEDEARQIFANPRIDAIKAFGSNAWSELEVERTLSFDGSWETGLISWASVGFVQRGATKAPEEWNQDFGELLDGIKIASNVAPASKELEQIAGKATEKKDTWEASQPALTQMLGKLTSRMQATFRLVPAVRDAKFTEHGRLAAFDSQIQAKIWALEQSTLPESEETFSKVERTFEAIASERYDAVSAKGYIRQGARRFPMTLQGGGVQAAMNLSYELVAGIEPNSIIGLEEPELHSHPTFQRRLFALLTQLSQESQLIVVTHSAIFIDRSQPTSTWIVRKSQDGTVVTQLHDWKEVTDELGVRPSDVFLADRLVFVEGEADRIFIQAVANVSGINLSGVQIIGLGGIGNALAKIKLAAGLFGSASRITVILDSDAKAIADQLRKEVDPTGVEIHTLSKGTVEDYYAPELVERAVEHLDDEYGLKIRTSDGWQKVKEGKLRLAEFSLGEKVLGLAGGWKAILAREVSRLVQNAEQVPQEIERILERVGQR